MGYRSPTAAASASSSFNPVSSRSRPNSFTCTIASSSLQDAESKISSLLTPSGANVSNSTAVAVTREEAIDKALKHVGLKKEDVKDLEVDLDTEREGVFWEINFDHKDQEFSFDINANTGEIVSSKREPRD